MESGSKSVIRVGSRKSENVRGNLNTRLRKLDAAPCPYAALVLATAGLQRMGWAKRISKCRADNEAIVSMLAPFSHAETYCRILAERSFLKTLGNKSTADCILHVSMLAPFSHAETYCRILAERSFLKTLGNKSTADCILHVSMLAPFSHAETYCRILAERSFLKTLGNKSTADCILHVSMLAPFSHAETYCRILAERSFLKTLGNKSTADCILHVSMLAPFSHAETYCRILAERSFLKTLGNKSTADCILHVSMLAPFSHAETYCRILAERSFLKTLEPEPNPIEVLNNRITEKTDLSCEDTRSSEEIEALSKNDDRIFCGLTVNNNIPIDVIIKCDNLGKDLAEALIAKGALEVMKISQDYIRNSTVDR
ncbi:Uncharacterized protein OBRU01_07318 [Operophtera brumata]|uniref:hydroxymethylbilane synthase n=1 Tax=Operophtera brumata TaxID=104452 RepID=A0A0L7LJL9_OPEBR|nr:Uncharacterized protein OBRU01_07318 [Operophtera brumata]